MTLYPHRLSASTVSVVCGRANCTLPAQHHHHHQQKQQQVVKDNCVDYYVSADPSCLPPPPPSSCSQVSQAHSCAKVGCEMNTECKCLSPPSQPLMQQQDASTTPRFRKNFESNGVEQRVIFSFLFFYQFKVIQFN